METVKEGDRLIKTTRYGQGIVTVTRLTETQIIANDGQRYNRRTGKIVGRFDVYDVTFLETATEEQLAAVRKKNAMRKARAQLSRHDWKQESDDTVAAVLLLIGKKEGEQ